MTRAVDSYPLASFPTVIDGNHQRAAASQLVEERRVTQPQADSQDLVVRRRVPAIAVHDGMVVFERSVHGGHVALNDAERQFKHRCAVSDRAQRGN